MPARRESMNFEPLDICHHQMHRRLNELLSLAERLVQAGAVDAESQALAAEIEAFFSGSSRQHHREEERYVFPPLLNSGIAALEATVRSLQQDHGWIEENWIALAPQLRGIAAGSSAMDMEEFQHSVAVFHDLVQGHIALEETLIYPESKARWAQLVAAREARLAG